MNVSDAAIHGGEEAENCQRNVRHADHQTGKEKTSEVIKEKNMKKNKTCTYNDCKKKYFCKGLCQMHWERMYRYGRLERLRSVTGISYTKNKKEYMKAYLKLHPEIKSIKSMNKKRFGGLRSEILKRDGYKCVDCGMTNEEHIKKWKRNLTINHIDHKGRYSYKQNNNLENLETLCLKCHGFKDRSNYKLYGKGRGVRKL